MHGVTGPAFLNGLIHLPGGGTALGGASGSTIHQRNPRVSLCVLDEKWPPTHLLVYGNARIVMDFEAVVDLGMRIMALMAQQPIPESHRPDVAERARREKRIMLRITPYMTFESPPRHVYKPDDVKGLTHGLGTSLPWAASS